MQSLPGSLASRTEPAADATSSEYLDRLMRRGCFEALWPLFAKAERPAKELTESYAALLRLRPYLTDGGPCRVLHVGDGAHARTAAMFCLKTQAHNVSVDPQLNIPLVDAWRARFGIHRLECRKARIEDVAAELNALPPMLTLVTFVHAHVSVDDVLARLRWDAAFTLACCVPGKQLSQKHLFASGIDRHVLSEGRQWQVLRNRETSAADSDARTVVSTHAPSSPLDDAGDHATRLVELTSHASDSREGLTAVDESNSSR